MRLKTLEGRLWRTLLAPPCGPLSASIETNVRLPEGVSALARPAGLRRDPRIDARGEPFDLNAIPAEVLAVTIGADVALGRV